MDKTAWSGTYFYAYQAIKKIGEVQILHYTWPWYIREELIFHKQIQKLHNRKIAVEFLRGYAKWFSKKLEKELCNIKPDVLFVPGAPQLIAYCNTRVPIIYMADATFKQLQGYYDSFGNLAPYNIQQGIDLDRSAINNATHCMLASDWAKQSAMNDYHIPENKITVQPLGANLDLIPAVSELKKEKIRPVSCFSWALNGKGREGRLLWIHFMPCKKRDPGTIENCWLSATAIYQ